MPARTPESPSSASDTTLSLREESLTSPGEAIGTVSYMSPEQARGEELDARTDIFSIGCVLYEMATGQPPFIGSTSALIFDSILHATPAPPSKSSPEVPQELESSIYKALEKDREMRCQSAAELRADLKRLQRDSDSAKPISAKRRLLSPGNRSRAWKLLLALALIVFLAVAVSVNDGKLRDWLPGTARAPKIRSIAVLPLENLSRDPEQEYFAEGMTDQLITNLAKLGALRVISRTSAMQYKGTRKTVPQIAKELGVDAVVEGAVLRSGNRVRITSQLIAGPNEKHIWAESYERDLRDVLSLQSEVARTIVREIRVQVTPQEQSHLSDNRPINPQAHEDYLRAKYFAGRLSPDEFQKAIGYFNQALNIDPTYASAYADLAETYCWATALQVIPSRDGLLKAKAAALQAIEINDSIGEAHNALAWAKYVNDWDFTGAEQEFKHALELSPSEANIHLWYGNFLAQAGRLEESRAEMESAKTLDPLSPMVGSLAVLPLLAARQYDDALRQLEKVLELDPNAPVARFYLQQAYEGKGDFPSAIKAAADMALIFGEPPDSVKKRTAALSQSYSCLGPKGYWLSQLTSLKDEWKRNPGDSFSFAMLYAHLGDRDQTFHWLDKAVQQHSQEMTLGLITEPAFDSLRSDPRFQDVLRRIGRLQ